MRPISAKEVNKRYLNWLNNPDVNRFLESRLKKQTIKDIVGYINGLRSAGCEVFAIFLRHDDSHIGNLAITGYVPFYKRIEYGLMIADTKARMLGAGGEAEILFLEYIFKKAGMRRVYGGVIADNIRSRKLVESVGFVQEGLLRQHCVLASGKVNDAYFYGMLKKDWLKSRKRFMAILKFMEIEEKNKFYEKGGKK